MYPGDVYPSEEWVKTDIDEAGPSDRFGLAIGIQALSFLVLTYLSRSCEESLLSFMGDDPANIPGIREEGVGI